MPGWEKTVINVESGAVPRTRVPSSAHAVRFGPLIFVTGQSGRGSGATEYDPDPAVQARQCLDNIGAILAEAGTSFEHVLKRTIIVRNRAEYASVRPIIDAYFPSPVASVILEAGLLRDEEKAIEIEVIAGLPNWTGAEAP